MTPGRAIPLGSAFGLMPLAFVTSVLAATAAQGLGLPPLVLVPFVMLVGIALPAWVVAAVTTGDARSALGLTTPPARAIAGALLLGGCFWYVNAAFIAPLVAGQESASDRQLAGLVGGGDALALKIVAIALAPAVCEEILVRGAIARAIAARGGLWIGVLVSSLYFAAMHVSLARAAPTFALGALLAIATLRSGSTIPAMIVHLLNNAIALVIAASGAAPDARLLAPAALAGTTVGVALLWTSLRR